MRELSSDPEEIFKEALANRKADEEGLEPDEIEFEYQGDDDEA